MTHINRFHTAVHRTEKHAGGITAHDKAPQALMVRSVEVHA